MSLLLKVSVRDYGIGMTEQEQSKVFETRHLTENTSDSAATSEKGISLPLCKQICERLGGSIGVYSRPNSGS